MRSNKKPPFISVVIASKDREVFLRDCLNSLMNQTYRNFEVIVVDDGIKPRHDRRTNSVIQRYLKNGMNIKLLINKNSIGTPRSLNRGVSESQGYVVVFTDDDCITNENWLTQLSKAYSQRDVASVGGKVIPVEFDSIWSLKSSTTSIIGKVTWDGMVIGNFDKGNKTVFVDCLSGANMSFRKELLIKVGGFDSTYDGNAYRFETDLCLKIRRLGIKIVYNPNAVVYHRRARKGRNRIEVEAWNYWYSRNHVLFILRNFKGRLSKLVLFCIKQISRMLNHRRVCPYGKSDRWDIILINTICGIIHGLIFYICNRKQLINE